MQEQLGWESNNIKGVLLDVSKFAKFWKVNCKEFNLLSFTELTLKIIMQAGNQRGKGGEISPVFFLK